MVRQYPHKKRLLEIADAADNWAKTIRNDWLVSDATSAENPARFVFFTAATQRQAACHLDRFAQAALRLKACLADVEEGDPLADCSPATQRCYPAHTPSPKAVAGWPSEVDNAIRVLNQIDVEEVHRAFEGD